MTRANCAGVWHTDFGCLELKVEGSRVTGTYGPNAGELKGELSGNTVRGTWRQSAPCHGGVTWGTFEMAFSGDGRSFTCRWQYMDYLAPGWGNWYGRRGTTPGREGVRATVAAAARRVTNARRRVAVETSAPHPMKGVAPALRQLTSTAASRFAGAWCTDHGEMELWVVGNLVTGTYEPNAGRFEGVISGNQITGTWRQESECASGLTWGVVTLTLSADGKKLTGRWHYQDDYAPGWGNWYCYRAAATTAKG